MAYFWPKKLHVMSWFKDKNGKVSSKRIFGAVLVTFGAAMALLGGFEWYHVNETLTITVISIGAGLLGVSLAEKKQ